MEVLHLQKANAWKYTDIMHDPLIGFMTTKYAFNRLSGLVVHDTVDCQVCFPLFIWPG